jgi:hypothetical protein
VKKVEIKSGTRREVEQGLAGLNNIEEFSPYLKENTTFHHYKDQLVNAV